MVNFIDISLPVLKAWIGHSLHSSTPPPPLHHLHSPPFPLNYATRFLLYLLTNIESNIKLQIKRDPVKES
jgi:hypothetical protein